MKKLVYPALFKPFSDGSGGYVVEFPDLPGCVTGGNTLEEAIEMAIDAASGWILGELEDGNQIPKPSAYSNITVEEGEIVNMLLLDIDSYEEKYGEKAVRKNLTIKLSSEKALGHLFFPHKNRSSIVTTA